MRRSSSAMPERPVVYIDTSTIREGKLEELEMAMRHLAALVEANVPQLISYASSSIGTRPS